METLEILLKIVMPVGIAIYLTMRKKEIKRMLSNFGSTSKATSHETDPDIIAEKLDTILRHYND